MKMNKSIVYDALVIGAGHNGLTCACYLAKAGLNVLVVEQYHQIGGMTATEEFYPGFYTDIHASCYQLAGLCPAAKELNLANYGFNLINPNLGFAKLFPDNRYLCIMRNIDDTCQTISQFSKRDAQTWQTLFQHYLQQKEMIAESLNNAPIAMSQLLLNLENTPQGMDFNRFQMQSVRSWCQETFESDAMKIFMADFSAHGDFSPDDAGGAQFSWAFTSIIQDFGNQIVKGGMGCLPTALASYLSEHGGKVMTNANVVKITTHNGRATGVKLADGTKLLANHVISSIHPKHLVLDLLKDTALDNALVQRMENIALGESSMAIHVALSEPITYRAGNALSQCPQIHVSPDTIDEMAQAYCDTRAGRLPEKPAMFVINEGAIDSDRVPSGKSSIKIVIRTLPYKVDWKSVKNEYADHIFNLLSHYIPDLKEKTLESVLVTPIDYENKITSSIHGTLSHGAIYPYQAGAMRPIYGLGNYQGPIDNVYLCGSGSHPGPGVSMMPGRNAALVISKDILT